MKRRKSNFRRNPLNVPLSVFLGMAIRQSILRDRRTAQWWAGLAAITSPVALLVGLFTTGMVRNAAVCHGIIAAIVAILLWLIIRWMDRTKSWRATSKRPRNFRFWLR
jgi:uncharacterized membrane protein